MTTYHQKVKDSSTALQAYKTLESVWSPESALRTKTLILQLEKQEQTNRLLQKIADSLRANEFHLREINNKLSAGIADISEMNQRQKQNDAKAAELTAKIEKELNEALTPQPSLKERIKQFFSRSTPETEQPAAAEVQA